MIYTIEEMLLQCVDTETGELDEDKLNALTLANDIKIENSVLWVKNLISDADAIKKEIDAFKKREKVLRNNADRLKTYLTRALEGKKFETARCAVSFITSKKVEISDVKSFCKQYKKEYCRKTIEYAPDKEKIRKAIESGVEIEGAYISTNSNIQIK